MKEIPVPKYEKGGGTKHTYKLGSRPHHSSGKLKVQESDCWSLSPVFRLAIFLCPWPLKAMYCFPIGYMKVSIK